MDLQESSHELKSMHEQYLAWRTLRHDLHEVESEQTLPEDVVELCRQLLPGMLLGNRGALGNAVDGLELNIKALLAERRQEAGLPSDLVCITLVWDRVSGEVLEARIQPDETAQAASPRRTGFKAAPLGHPAGSTQLSPRQYSASLGRTH